MGRRGCARRRSGGCGRGPADRCGRGDALCNLVGCIRARRAGADARIVAFGRRKRRARRGRRSPYGRGFTLASGAVSGRFVGSSLVCGRLVSSRLSAAAFCAGFAAALPPGFRFHSSPAGFRASCCPRAVPRPLRVCRAPRLRSPCERLPLCRAPAPLLVRAARAPRPRLRRSGVIPLPRGAGRPGWRALRGFQLLASPRFVGFSLARGIFLVAQLEGLGLREQTVLLRLRAGGVLRPRRVSACPSASFRRAARSSARLRASSASRATHALRLSSRQLLFAQPRGLGFGGLARFLAFARAAGVGSALAARLVFRAFARRGGLCLAREPRIFLGPEPRVFLRQLTRLLSFTREAGFFFRLQPRFFFGLAAHLLFGKPFASSASRASRGFFFRFAGRRFGFGALSGLLRPRARAACCLGRFQPGLFLGFPPRFGLGAFPRFCRFAGPRVLPPRPCGSRRCNTAAMSRFSVTSSASTRCRGENLPARGRPRYDGRRRSARCLRDRPFGLTCDARLFFLAAALLLPAMSAST